ncbi:MAG: alpha-glucan family phosphorylase, partial [Saprospiraceae bacterium]
FIESKLPEALAPLQELAGNIWWSWNKEAIHLFRAIEPELWESVHHNPIALLDGLSVETTRRLLEDKDFMARLKSVNKAFQAYLKEVPAVKTPHIGYFSMEYGLHISVRLYSGGLGVLAGDYLKEASDANINLTAVGLLYRYGYFQQAVSLNGDQIHQYPPQQFTKMPIHPVRDQSGEWLKVSVQLKDSLVWAKVWELQVGRISLYLLDTDIDENRWEDRALTHQLYGGNNEHRLKQEILLGIGGVRALKALNITPDLFHINEGHAAFLALERLRQYMGEEKLSFNTAVEVVRSTSLFTTHTPVPAGHDYFPEGALREYLADYIADLGIPWQQFMALGKIEVNNPSELFSMSHLAIRLSQEVNGVSKLHGDVSQKMFSVLYPGYHPEELHVGYVTNSVHYPTWIGREWHELYEKTFGKNFLRDQSNPVHWRKIHSVPDDQVMAIRQVQKQRLIRFVKRKLQEDLQRRGENPRAIFSVLNAIREDALMIGFARRFATYKRAHLLFSNPERLSQIVNDPERPVMFIFAGKAHPADGGGQDLIRSIINTSKRPEFLGKVIFLEDYNMEMAKTLVRGVDIWLNNPVRPKEASGTSGMKAVLNGVMNFSVLDGWWVEGYRPDAGWALPLENTYDDPNLQDQLDAETIYNILEYDIAPTYYERDEKGISAKWVNHVKQTIAEIAPQFTMKRMLDDYFDRFYNKLYERSQIVKAKNYAKASELASWKSDMREDWDKISVSDMQVFDSDNHPLPVGQPFEATISLDINGLPAQRIGVEVAFFRRLSDDEMELKITHELQLTNQKGSIATYACALDPHMSGVYEYGFRVFPKHELLPHRQDLNLVKWL